MGEVSEQQVNDTQTILKGKRLGSTEKSVLGDGFDIRMLAEQAGINEGKLKEAMGLWPDKKNLKAVLRNREILGLIPHI